MVELWKKGTYVKYFNSRVGILIVVVCIVFIYLVFRYWMSLEILLFGLKMRLRVVIVILDDKVYSRNKC